VEECGHSHAIKRVVRLPSGEERHEDFCSPVSLLLHDLPADIRSPYWSETKLLTGLAVPPTSIQREEAFAALRALRVLEQELYLVSDDIVRRLCRLDDTEGLQRYWKGEQSAMGVTAKGSSKQNCPRAAVPAAAEAFHQVTPCPVPGCSGEVTKIDDYNRRSVDEETAEIVRCNLCGWQRV
jgi:hypothetical protein